MSPAVIAKRVAAQIEDDFVVFLIGLRLNKPWNPMSYWQPLMAMGPMLKELKAQGPSSGLLHFEQVGMFTFVQYWRSFEHLEAYARDANKNHWPAWVEFNRRMKNRRGDVGIWHETYLVKAGQYEAVYSGMPHYGLAVAGQNAEITEQTDGARKRLGAQAGE